MLTLHCKRPDAQTVINYTNNKAEWQLVSVTPAEILYIMRKYFVFMGMAVKAKFVSYADAKQIAGNSGAIVRADKVGQYLFGQMSVC